MTNNPTQQSIDDEAQELATLLNLIHLHETADRLEMEAEAARSDANKAMKAAKNQINDYPKGHWLRVASDRLCRFGETQFGGIEIEYKRFTDLTKDLDE
ncbi:MAG: hypothetical protein F6J87_30180 [Spirulina sp. SIO3F2]|nr:hypothetical protein [Spirulina sp. SIO3F2]